MTDAERGNRNLRPSDSSIENDSIVFTYAQRFSKLPYEENAAHAKEPPLRRPRPKADLTLNEVEKDEKLNDEERNKDVNSSDTENASPAITFGPKDNSSVSGALLLRTRSV